MKLKTIKKFFDSKERVFREVNSEFETTKERGTLLIQRKFAVEVENKKTKE